MKTEQRRSEQTSFGEYLFDAVVTDLIGCELLYLDRAMVSDFKAAKTQTHLDQDRVPFPQVSQEPSSYSYPVSLLTLSHIFWLQFSLWQSAKSGNWVASSRPWGSPFTLKSHVLACFL